MHYAYDNNIGDIVYQDEYQNTKLIFSSFQRVNNTL